MNKPSILYHFDRQFKDIKLLGSGHFGETHLVYDKTNKKYYSLKLLYPRDIPLKDYQREVNALIYLSKYCHPSIVCYINHFIVQGYTNYKNQFVNQTYYGILTEYINGVTLNQYQHNHHLSHQHILTIGLWLLKTISLLHSLNFAHNDISLSNIMVTHKGNLKLIDFGLSCITDKKTLYNSCLKTRLVNESYISPELQNGLYQTNVNFYSKTSDVFAVGLVLYELVTGRHPYQHDSHGRIISSYADLRQPSLFCLNKVLKNLLMIDTRFRITAQQGYNQLLKCK